MSKDNLLIPTKLRIGFNKRDDTYSKKLAYIIYYDTKGKIRKEDSFNSWRDHGIAVIETDNVPTSGFVLNKEVGGGGSRGWEHVRAEKIRIYDPRDFEFEISTSNLIYILQECSSIKGKGLEGEFVYAWDGKDLMLLPVASREYKASTKYTLLQNNKVSAKELVEGHTYINKEQEQLLYIGKFIVKWDEKYNRIINYVGKQKYVFWKGKNEYKNLSKTYEFEYLNGLETIASKISDTIPENFADLFNFVSTKMSGEIESICKINVKTSPDSNEKTSYYNYYYNSLKSIQRYENAKFYSIDGKIYSLKIENMEIDVAINSETGEKLRGVIEVSKLDKEYVIKNGVIAPIPVKKEIIFDHIFYFENRNYRSGST